MTRPLDGGLCMEAYRYVANDYPMITGKYGDYYCAYCATDEYSETLDDYAHSPEHCLWKKIQIAEELRKASE